VLLYKYLNDECVAVVGHSAVVSMRCAVDENCFLLDTRRKSPLKMNK